MRVFGPKSLPWRSNNLEALTIDELVGPCLTLPKTSKSKFMALKTIKEVESDNSEYEEGSGIAFITKKFRILLEY